MKIEGKSYKTIWFENSSVKIIDQTKLPHQFVIKSLNEFLWVLIGLSDVDLLWNHGRDIAKSMAELWWTYVGVFLKCAFDTLSFPKSAKNNLEESPPKRLVGESRKCFRAREATRGDQNAARMIARGPNRPNPR